MVHFVEPLATEQLWHWLEVERGWRVDSEVDTGNGRIDLACETPDGRYVGVELKAGSGLSWGAQLSEQLWRYVDSGYFDAVYFASPSVDRISEMLDGSSVEPLIPVISHASRKLRAGVQEGQYTSDEVLRRIEEEVAETILSYEFSDGRRTVRKYIRTHLEDRTERSLDPIPIEAGIRDISRSVLPESIGLIETPLPLQGGYLRGPRMALTPGEVNEPKIVREPTTLTRTRKPTFDREQEPWVRHSVWEKFGGLPEGSVPNVMESERIDRPIDLVSFEENWDPTEILESDSGAVIGVEAKGRGSFSAARVVSQLSECLETHSFSQFYLAVPDAIQKQASDLVTKHDGLEPVGIIVIDEEGHMTTVREAKSLDLEHDGYKHGSDLHKTGYGDVRIPRGQDVTSPFVLSEWREPLTDDAGEKVIWDYDPRKTDTVIDDIDELEVSESVELRDCLKQQARNASTSRAYLLTGHSAAPYVTGQNHGREEPKYGYVRMSVQDFETSDGEYALDIHFGAGGWEGGYICFVGDQVDSLVSVLSSLEHISRGSIPGQGQYIDLKTFRWEYGENYEFKLGHEENREQLFELNIESTQTADGVGAIIRLGEELQQGVEVTMTETQRVDFLRTLRIMRYGRPSELPGDGGGYQRVGPDGNDTWDRGTDVEKDHNPEELIDRPVENRAPETQQKNPETQSNDSPTSDDEIREGSTSLLDKVRSWIQ
jgi:hypothetical protein